MALIGSGVRTRRLRQCGSPPGRRAEIFRHAWRWNRLYAGAGRLAEGRWWNSPCCFDDYSAAGYPLLQIRYYLGYLLRMGAEPSSPWFFMKISSTYFMLRSREYIEDTIERHLKIGDNASLLPIGSPILTSRAWILKER